MDRRTAMRKYGYILSKVDIRDVVGAYETVEGSGRHAKAICPFHQDTNPSMGFYKRKDEDFERYHCFVCHSDGNAFDFVYGYETRTLHHDFTWEQAVEKVAGLAGLDISVTAYRRPMSDSEKAIDIEQRTFSYYLHTEKALPEVRRLFRMMRLDYSSPEHYELFFDTAREMGIGYAPDYRQLRKKLEAAGYHPGYLPSEGLTFARKDRDGRVRGFNPDIYAPHRIGEERLYITDSPEDVLAMHMAGFDSCISVRDFEKNAERIDFMADHKVIMTESISNGLKKASMLTGRVQIAGGSPSSSYEKDGADGITHIISDALYPSEFALRYSGRAQAGRLAASALEKENLRMIAEEKGHGL